MITYVSKVHAMKFIGRYDNKSCTSLALGIYHMVKNPVE